MDKDAMRSALDEEIRKCMDANKHWDQMLTAEESAARLAALREIPMFREVYEIAQGIGGVVVELRKTFEFYAEPIASFMEATRIAQENLGRWLLEHRELIEQFAKATPRIRKALESSGEIGHLGWTVTDDMELPVILHLSECRDTEAANAYMLKYYEREDSDLCGIEQRLREIDCLKPFAVGLDQSFTAFRNGQFALIIPFLILVLEHSLRSLDSPRPFPSTDMPKIVRTRIKRLRADERLAFAMKSLYSFTEDHYDHYDSRTDGGGRVRRKGIMHGLQVPPNEKVQAIRLYHVIDTVVQLYTPTNAQPAAE